MPPGRHNVRGYWEPAQLVKLHDRLLSDGGSAWDDWYPFDLESISPRLLSYYRRQISKIIAEEYGADPLLVIKDPRICRFVMLYDEVLAQLSINRYFVLPYRHPSSVISSLFARYRMAPDHAALIWLRYTLDSEAATRGTARTILAYEDLVHDWRPVVVRLLQAAHVNWPKKIVDVEGDLEELVVKDMAHHKPPVDPNWPKGSQIEQALKEAHSALQVLSENDGDETAIKTLATLKAKFDSGAFQPVKAIHQQILAVRLLEERERVR